MTSIENEARTTAAQADLLAEIDRLRGLVAERDAQLAAQRREMADLGRRVDDLLDRESMHVYDPDMERLATSAAIERVGMPRARRLTGRSTRPCHPEPVEITAPQIERGVWQGFER
ncbi:hypothetical protein [Nocardia testacea]|uniref:hypothetical protein n=1 Tax=Nocardia testacea TaxID=248551 RepID=UPI003A847CB3